MSWTALFLLTLGVVLRFLFLEADPSYALWIGYLTDEGRWVEQARNLALFGSLRLYNLSVLHLGLAPLFQAVTFMDFSLFGVSFAAARFFSALSGAALLVAFYLYMRRRATVGSLLAGTAAMALQPDLLFLSRVAIPEMPAMLWQFLAFICIVEKSHSIRMAAVAGILTAVALAMKATVAPVALIFSAIILLMPPDLPFQLKLRRFLAYVAVLALPAAVGLVLGLYVAGAGPVLDAFRTLSGFLAPSDFHSMVSLLFYGEYLQVINFLLMVAWLCGGVFLSGARLGRSRTAAVYLASLIWVIGWLLVSALMNYFPPRYVQHVLVPLIIHLVSAITLIQRADNAAFVSPADAAPARRNVFFALWIAFPMAVLASPFITGLLDLTDLVTDRLRERIAVIMAVGIVLAITIVKQRHRLWVWFGAYVLPLVTALVWICAVSFGAADRHFWAPAAREILLPWMAILAIAALITIAAFAGFRRKLRLPAPFAYAYLSVLVGTWVWEIAPNYLERSYTIADASVDLGRVLRESESVSVRDAASLFIANRIPYSEEIIRDPLPEYLVVAFDRSDQNLLNDYVLERTYELRIDSDYLYSTDGAHPLDETSTFPAKVYRRRE